MIVEPISLFFRVWYTIWDLFSRLKNAPSRIRNLHRLQSLRCGKSSHISVNYGFCLPSSDSIVIGGSVKLLHLRSRFPHREEGFNLIYLVSSALPAHAIDFVRAAKAQGCKFVWNQNGVAYPAWCGGFYPWFNRSMRELIHLADFVIYQSAFCQLSADRYLGKVDVPNVVLFNPVDMQVFSPAERPPDFSQCELLAAGTNHHFYRVLSSLKTLSILRKEYGANARLTIAGEFRWRWGNAQVRRAIRRLKLEPHVRFMPPFTQEQASTLYRNAHILLHPKYKDPCPTVPIEAMSSGIPVVGGNSGGMPELVPLGAGILAEVPEDWVHDHPPASHDLATAIIRIMSDYSTYSRIAREHALQTFDKEYWLQAHEAIFHALIMEKL